MTDRKREYATRAHLIGASFHPMTTVTYRIDGNTPISGRTVIIPDGFDDIEAERIQRAIRRIFNDEPSQDTAIRPQDPVLERIACALYGRMSDSDTPWNDLPDHERRFWKESVLLVLRTAADEENGK